MPTIAKFLGVARNSASKIGGVDYFSLGKMTGVQSFDPDAKAYIQRVEGASGDNQILEIGVRYAINDFVVGCKDDGIWTAIKASCIMAGARTLAGALQPLVGTAPTNNNFVSGDYNRETGLLGNGSTKYLNSNRNNNADPQNSNHNCFYAASANKNTTQVFIGPSGGSAAGINGVLMFQQGLYVRNRSSTAASLGVVLPLGFFGVSRSSSSGFTYRLNGSNASSSIASQTPYNANVCVFAGLNGDSPSDARLSFYSIGESIDLAKLDHRVSTLMTSIAAAI
jgi:hypothetical protein